MNIHTIGRYSFDPPSMCPYFLQCFVAVAIKTLSGHLVQQFLQGK
jgi:hypothetical protein